MYNAKNNAKTTLASSLSAVATSCTFVNGSAMPEGKFNMTIDDEIIYVTARTGDAGTGLIRGHEGTTPAAHAAGAAVECRFTAGMYDSLRFYIDQGEDPDYTGIKYRLVMIDGEAFMEVVDND